MKRAAQDEEERLRQERAQKFKRLKEKRAARAAPEAAPETAPEPVHETALEMVPETVLTVPEVVAPAASPPPVPAAAAAKSSEPPALSITGFRLPPKPPAKATPKRKQPVIMFSSLEDAHKPAERARRPRDPLSAASTVEKAPSDVAAVALQADGVPSADGATPPADGCAVPTAGGAASPADGAVSPAGASSGENKVMMGIDDDDNAQGALDVYLGETWEAEDDYFTLLAKHGGKRELEPIDHSKMNYPPIVKDVYLETTEIRSMTDREVDLLRKSHQIRVKGKGCPRPVQGFTQCGLPDAIMRKLDKKNITEPLPVQMQTLPALMSGRNVIAVATTGSGKTLGYLLPMIRLCRIQSPPLKMGEGPRGLVLVPTRELALQVGAESRRYASCVDLTTNVVYGGGRLGDQLSACHRGCDILVATPGRLTDILVINRGNVMKLFHVIVVTIDEADRMFDMGFGPQIERLLTNVRPDRQISLFSATFPRFIEDTVRHFVWKPLEIFVGARNRPPACVAQFLEYFDDEGAKFLRLLKILGEWYEHGECIIIFCHDQESVETLFVRLLNYGYPAIALHGGLDQEERELALIDFKAKTRTILLSTSIAARGIDVKNVVLVVNYDAPDHGEDYIHRIGRTGRAGQSGVAYTFFLPTDSDKAYDILPIARETGATIAPGLHTLADRYFTQIQEGTWKVRIKKGFEGQGYSFDSRFEQSQQQEAKNFWKKELGLVDDPALDENGEPEKGPVDPETLIQRAKEKIFEDRVQELLEEWTLSMLDPIAREAKKKSLDPTVRRVVEQEMQRLEMTGSIKHMVEKALNGDKPLSRKNRKKHRGSALQRAQSILASAVAGMATERMPKDYVDNGQHVIHFSINDYPSQARFQATQKDLLSSIADGTNTYIAMRGTFIDSARHQRPLDVAGQHELHIEIRGPTPVACQLAKQQIKDTVEAAAKRTLSLK